MILKDYTLSRNVWHTYTPHGIVFMDLGRDAYLLLSGPPFPEQTDLESWLRENHLVMRDDEMSRGRPTSQTPRVLRTLLRGPAPVGSFVACYAMDRVLKHDGPLRAIELALLDIAGGHGISPVEVRRTFEVGRRFYPRPRKCLLDSLALCLLARSRGLNPSIVFGVEEELLDFHCWLEVDGEIFNDHEENIEKYKKIASFCSDGDKHEF